MTPLIEYLSSRQARTISETATLDALLAACWDQFVGGEAEGMTGHKLRGRMNEVRWNPPVLTFVIDRHGRTVLGSTRADRHMWTLNIETRTASCQNVGHRQLQPMQAGLDLRPVAEDVARLIISHQEDERLRWDEDGSVRVQIGQILPQGSAVKQTLDGRRRRFRQMLDALLSNAGWQKVRPNVYAPLAT